jgi:hypothetical protein
MLEGSEFKADTYTVSAGRCNNGINRLKHGSSERTSYNSLISNIVDETGQRPRVVPILKRDRGIGLEITALFLLRKILERYVVARGKPTSAVQNEIESVTEFHSLFK